MSSIDERRVVLRDFFVKDGKRVKRPKRFVVRCPWHAQSSTSSRTPSISIACEQLGYDVLLGDVGRWACMGCGRSGVWQTGNLVQRGAGGVEIILALHAEPGQAIP